MLIPLYNNPAIEEAIMEKEKPWSSWVSAQIILIVSSENFKLKVILRLWSRVGGIVQCLQRKTYLL